MNAKHHMLEIGIWSLRWPWWQGWGTSYGEQTDGIQKTYKTCVHHRIQAINTWCEIKAARETAVCNGHINHCPFVLHPWSTDWSLWHTFSAIFTKEHIVPITYVTWTCIVAIATWPCIPLQLFNDQIKHDFIWIAGHLDEVQMMLNLSACVQTTIVLYSWPFRHNYYTCTIHASMTSKGSVLKLDHYWCLWVCCL